MLVALLVASWGIWSFAGQGAALMPALARLGPAGLAGALFVASFSLALRIWRWQLIVRTLGHRLPWALQSRAYLAGLALSSTPGKLGEASRAWLLQAHGVPVSATLAAFLCDRLADVLAVSLLGVVAARMLGHRWLPLEVLLAVSGLGAAALARGWLSLAGQRALAWAQQRGLSPAGRLRLAPWAAPLTAWARAWSHPRVAVWVLIAGLAYGVQAMIFFGFVDRLHPGVDPIRCVEIFCTSILIGAASLIPGGLGAMDAALVWQLQSDGVPLEAAMAATLATRACTLWFAWMVGLLAWTSFGREREVGAAA